MTPTELRAILKALGLTQAGGAHLLGMGTRQVQRMCCGDAPIPELVRRVLVLVVETPELADRLRGVPRGWRPPA